MITSNIGYYWHEEDLPIISAFSTRIGGVSKNPYHEFNMAYHVGDSPDNVAENRRRFCKAIGISTSSLVLAQQVHGDKIQVIEKSDAGRGSDSHTSGIPETDAMITNSRSVAIGVLTADCVPVMIFDPINKAIGVAHAGWKGTLLNIAAKTILKMKEIYSTNPSNCLVSLGPSIEPCCYEVGNEIMMSFNQTFGPVFAPQNRLNLAQAIEIQLFKIGVRSISHQNICTSCNTDIFYSYRAENGVTGRMISVILLK